MTDGGAAAATLAMDVGGSSVKLAWATRDGVAAHLPSVPVAALRQDGGGGGEDGRAGDVLTGLARLAARHAASPPPGLTPRSVGLAVPGIVDEDAGVGRLSTMLGWRDAPVRATVETACGLPVALGHDVSAGALAEGAHGAARGHADWLFVAVGTGLGSALVLGGRPYRGSAGWGGELGHVVADPDGPPCPCGKRGCAEVLASASALTRRYAEAAGGAPVTAEDVARRAAAGEPAAVRVWQQAVDALGTVVCGAVETLNPSLVVVGGGVARSGEQLLAPLRERLCDGVRFVQPSPPVVQAALGDRAGVHGAAMLGAALLEDQVLGGPR